MGIKKKKRSTKETNIWENMEGGRLRRRQGKHTQEETKKRSTCVITRRSFGAYILLGVCTSTAFYLWLTNVFVSLTDLEEEEIWAKIFDTRKIYRGGGVEITELEYSENVELVFLNSTQGGRGKWEKGGRQII